MVETRLTLEPEVQQILQCVDGGQNFLLSGGAGSGKTHSLIQVIKQILLENPTSKVVCITYTNIAVKEIQERINNENLNVSTIHAFLWDNIRFFQKEIKSTLVALANNPDIKKIKVNNLGVVPENFFDQCEKGIQYKEYLKLADGIISHDELLILAGYLFENYPKLSDIVKDKFNYIFIDEYQDTNEEVIKILLTHFKKSNRKNIVGFFGDAMQSIYDDSVGNLDAYKGEGLSEVKEIKKEQNRRNPIKVVELANRLRTDGLTQVISVKDLTAPNVVGGKAKEGIIKFIYSTNPDVEKVRNYLSKSFNWNFSDSSELKELNLTHNLIADKAGFKSLIDIYDRDPVVGLKNDIVAKIKANKKDGKPEVVFDENDTFDSVIETFQLKNKAKELKKTVLLADKESAKLYEYLKNKPFVEVRKIYLDKDSLIDDKKQDKDDENKPNSNRDNLIKHLFKIQDNIFLYQDRQYNEFLRVTDFVVSDIKDKVALQSSIDELINVGEKTIEEIIDLAHKNKVCLIDDRLEKFKTKNEYIYNRVKEVKFKEFQKLYEYLEGHTPFSTQHKVKGTEFNNVLVILDNGGWANYNFEVLFLGSGTATVLERTQKLFYVCCTRAKENLAVFYHDPSSEVISKANEWFGEENVMVLS